MDLNKQVNTAGAFLLVDGLFAFMVGPNKQGELCVVRFGGHRENSETALECLRREMKEEVSITVKPVSSPITYYAGSWEEEPKLIEQTFEAGIYPINIKGEEHGPLSILYLAYSEEEPIPDSETNGILFLNLADIELICRELITIDDFINNGGRALFHKELRRDIILKPGVHLKFLSMLIKKHPDLLDKFIKRQL